MLGFLLKSRVSRDEVKTGKKAGVEPALLLAKNFEKKLNLMVDKRK